MSNETQVTYDGDYLYRIEEGGTRTRLCNFDARIAKIEWLPNGRGYPTEWYTIEARTNERTLDTVKVPAAPFRRMRWIRRLGRDAIVEPVLGAEKHIRDYILKNSTPVIVPRDSITTAIAKEGKSQ